MNIKTRSTPVAIHVWRNYRDAQKQGIPIFYAISEVDKTGTEVKRISGSYKLWVAWEWGVEHSDKSGLPLFEYADGLEKLTGRYVPMKHPKSVVAEDISPLDMSYDAIKWRANRRQQIQDLAVDLPSKLTGHDSGKIEINPNQGLSTEFESVKESFTPQPLDDHRKKIADLSLELTSKLTGHSSREIEAALNQGLSTEFEDVKNTLTKAYEFGLREGMRAR